MTKKENTNSLPVEVLNLLQEVTSSVSEENLNSFVNTLKTTYGTVNYENVVLSFKEVLLKHCVVIDNSHKIWDDVLLLKLNVFGIESQSVSKYCYKVDLDPTKLFFKLHDDNINATSIISFISQELAVTYPNKYLLNVVMPNLYSVELVG